MNEMQIFNNSEFGELGLIIIDGKEYFPATACAKMLGYTNPHKAINDHCKSTVKHKISHPQNSDKTIEMNFISKEDLSLLLAKSMIISISDKQKIISELSKQGCNLNLIALSRDEIEFLDLLESVLEPFNYKCTRQYKCKNYRIDLYIEDLKVAVEYDEKNHSNYSYESQEGRQKEIEESLGCKFIRVGDKNSHAYNVGLVISEIIKLKGQVAIVGLVKDKYIA